MVDRLQQEKVPDPDQRRQPAGHHEQGEPHRDGPEPDRRGACPRGKPEWAPAGEGGEDGRAQTLGGEKEGGEDRGEGPRVAREAQGEAGLQVVVLPPEPLEVGPAPPEARGVVELEEPPAADGSNGNPRELATASRQVRLPRPGVDQRVGEQNVAGPDDRREPLADGAASREQQGLRRADDEEPDPAVGRHRTPQAQAFRSPRTSSTTACRHSSRCSVRRARRTSSIFFSTTSVTLGGRSMKRAISFMCSSKKANTGMDR